MLDDGAGPGLTVRACAGFRFIHTSNPVFMRGGGEACQSTMNDGESWRRA